MTSSRFRLYAGRRVLVTGHTGFKGGWLALWLRKLEADVTGFSLPPDSTPSLFDAARIAGDVVHVEGDVRDRAALHRVFCDTKPEIVFHLAAQPLVTESYRNPIGTISTNVMGVVNVLEEVRSAGRPCAVVMVTSDKCYENQEWTYGYRETNRLGGHDPYSASKAAAELLIQSYRQSYFAAQSHSTHGIAVASARAGNVIGGGDWARDRILPDCVRALSSADIIRLRRPDAVRPWQHVLEPVSGYLTLGLSLRSEEAPRFCEAWNFGPETKSQWSVRALVEAVLSRWGSGKWEVTSDTAHRETAWLCLSIEKTRTKLGWSPRWELERAVFETVRWYRRFYDGNDVRELCTEQIAGYEEGAECPTPKIAGVRITPLRTIPDERGTVFHMLRSDAAHFEAFGEIYFSSVYPGVVKAWHIHERMTLNYAVPIGQIKLVLFDDRADSASRGALMEIHLGEGNYALVTVPPLIWNGFKGVGTKTALVANCATIPHDPTEIRRVEPATSSIPYNWDLKHG